MIIALKNKARRFRGAVLTAVLAALALTTAGCENSNSKTGLDLGDFEPEFDKKLFSGSKNSKGEVNAWVEVCYVNKNKETIPAPLTDKPRMGFIFYENGEAAMVVNASDIDPIFNNLGISWILDASTLPSWVTLANMLYLGNASDFEDIADSENPRALLFSYIVSDKDEILTLRSPLDGLSGLEGLIFPEGFDLPIDYKMIGYKKQYIKVKSIDECVNVDIPLPGGLGTVTECVYISKIISGGCVEVTVGGTTTCVDIKNIL